MPIKGNSKDWQVRLRLWAAIIMIAYSLGYFTYYVLGLFSVEWMERYQDVLSNLWPLFWVIPIVILTHVSLALLKIYKRNTFKMPLWEIAQIILGISLPFFLIPHIIYTYGAFFFFGVKQTYIDQIMATYPQFAWQFTVLCLVLWSHAQIGAHAVLRMRKWYPKVRILIATILTVMPIIGIVGYFKGGMELEGLLKKNIETVQLLTAQQLNALKNITYLVYIIFSLLYGFILTARNIRIKQRNKNKNITIHYNDG